MTNLSTLYKLVNNDLGSSNADDLANEMMLMEEFTSDLLFQAPEAAVSKILGFARSYTTLPSRFLEEIEIFKN